MATKNGAKLGIIGDILQADRLWTRAASLDHSNRITFLSFLEEDEDVLGHMRTAHVFKSPSTWESFGITFAERWRGLYWFAADRPKFAAKEIVGGAEFIVEPSVDSVAKTLGRALDGDRLQISPRSRAERYDWNNVIT